MKEVIVHLKSNVTTVKMEMTKRYMHLWNLCLIIKKFLVEVWWHFSIGQLGFRFRRNVSYDTTGFGFIPGSLEDTDKHIEVAYRNHVTAKQKVQVQITMCNNNGDTFIVTLYNVLLAPDICDRLFSIITLINLGHTCLFHKGFCMVYFGDEKENSVTLPHSA